MGIFLIVLLFSAVAFFGLLGIKKLKYSTGIAIALAPILAFIIIANITAQKSLDKGYFEEETYKVVENLYEGKYLFKRDVDGGYTVLIKSGNDLSYKKLLTVNKDDVYDPDKQLYFVVYRTKVVKTDPLNIGFKSSARTKYAFRRR